jgi:hypothetical protein
MHNTVDNDAWATDLYLIRYRWDANALYYCKYERILKLKFTVNQNKFCIRFTIIDLTFMFNIRHDLLMIILSLLFVTVVVYKKYESRYESHCVR